MRLIDADPLWDEWLDAENTETYSPNDVLYSIDAQPTVELPRWIPVTERMPDLKLCPVKKITYSEAVVVWTKSKKLLTATFDGTDFLCNEEFWEDEDDEVLYWMDGLALLKLLPDLPGESHGTEA